MKTNLLMDSVRNISVDLLKVQSQMTSGLRILRPSDAPGDATTVMHLDGMLERQQQFLRNIDYAIDYLATTDDALGQAVELVDQAHSLALGSIGVATDDAGRAANAQIIDQISSQLVAIANRSCRGSYIFAGQNTTVSPFELTGDGVRFTGTVSSKQTSVAADTNLTFNSSGAGAFGALSGQVVGSADLDPTIVANTLLSSLNGYLDQGIRPGSIIVSDGTDSATIDLSTCVTVGDVVDKINAEAPGTVAAMIDPAAGMGFRITAGAGDTITVNEVGTGYTARDLGIYDITGPGVGNPLVGQDVDARLTLATPISALVSGAGIDTSGLVITNSVLSPSSVTIAIPTAVTATLGDVVNAINSAGIGARAEINDAGTGINVFNQISGSNMTISESGGTSAADLGIRSMTAGTLLADLNAAVGVHTETGADDIQISVDAVDFTVNLDSASTVQDVIDLINVASTAAGLGNVASFATTGNGIVITSGGAASISVSTINQSGYDTAAELGLNQTVAASTLTGTDVNPAMPDGVFSHLIALRDALLNNDDAAISAAVTALDTSRQVLSDAHGQVGAKMQTAETRKAHTEDNILANETLRSDLRDIDFTEAVTRYENLTTALQANLTAGSNLISVSLLDFLG